MDRIDFNDRINREIIRRFCRGAEPSRIDAIMGMRNGSAREIIVAWWLYDKRNDTGGLETAINFPKKGIWKVW